MSGPRLAATLIVPLAVTAACARGPAPVAEADVTRAREALAPFQRQLLGALTKALSDGGPEAAIDVCRLEAPAIAKSAAGPGVALGRTSHRLRNPANAPPAWTEPLLAAAVADPANAAPQAVRLDGGRIGYVEPIRVKPMCLACHGEDIAPTVRERLQAGYPEDRATGFRDGDFRGLFWVEIPASS